MKPSFTLPANVVLDSCDSTNNLAKELGDAGYPHGTWIAAHEQSAGRGRFGRTWISKKGNLFLSMVVRIPEKQLWTWLPLTAALAVSDAIKLSFPSVPIMIKWPNDLWVRKLKLGGILCEAVDRSANSFVVIGVGVNCEHSPEEAATSLSAETGTQVSADAIGSSVVNYLVAILHELTREGISKIRDRYNSQAVFPIGSQIRWLKLQNKEDKEAHWERGIIENLGNSAELLVTTSLGKSISLFAEEIQNARD